MSQLIYLKGKYVARGDLLDITYKTRKMERICTDAKAAEKALGREMAAIIHQRIDEITAAETVEMMIQFHIGRCHPLRQNEYSDALKAPVWQ